MSDKKHEIYMSKNGISVGLHTPSFDCKMTKQGTEIEIWQNDVCITYTCNGKMSLLKNEISCDGSMFLTYKAMPWGGVRPL